MTATPQTAPDGGPDDAPRIVQDRATLMRMLDEIDREGWDGPTATALLDHLRERLVRPLAIGAGLRGAAASQAEATAWQALWVELTKPSIRTVHSPWGVLGQVARRQLLGEIVAARFATNDRRGWKLEVSSRDGAVRPMISLDALLEVGWEPESRHPDLSRPAGRSGATDAARRALRHVGWSEAEATGILTAVLDATAQRRDDRIHCPGWRLMATTLGLPPWQARRLTIALRGTSDWPGVLARIVAEGPSAIYSPVVRTALMATRRRSDRSPVLAARRAEKELSDAHPQRQAN